MSLNIAGLKVDIPLSNLAFMKSVDENQFMVDKVFKTVMSEVRSGKVYEFGNEHLRIYDSNQTTSGIANSINQSISQGYAFNIPDPGYGLKTFLPDANLKFAPEANRKLIETAAASSVITSLRLQKEKEGFAELFNTTNMSSRYESLGAADKFSNPASDPLKKITDATRYVKQNTLGKRANKLILTGTAMEALKNHPSVIARTRSDAGRIVTAAILKDILNDGNGSNGYDSLGIDEIIVVDTYYLSSNPGSTDVSTAVASNAVMVAHIPDNLVGNTGTLCFQAVLKDFENQQMNRLVESRGSAPVKIFKFKSTPEEQGYWYKAEMSYDLVFGNKDYGYLLTDVI